MIVQLNEIIDSYKEDIIRDTQKLMAYNSVYEKSDQPGQPFGQQIAAALECALEMATGMGFKTRNVDGYVGEIDYGTCGKKIGMIAHIDIVPAGDGPRCRSTDNRQRAQRAVIAVRGHAVG